MVNFCSIIAAAQLKQNPVSLQSETAADEPRVLCIIQDTTNAKVVTQRLTLNLPASTPLKQLFEDVSAKAGYINATFELVWSNGLNNPDQVILRINTSSLETHRVLSLTSSNNNQGNEKEIKCKWNLPAS